MTSTQPGGRKSKRWGIQSPQPPSWCPSGYGRDAGPATSLLPRRGHHCLLARPSCPAPAGRHQAQGTAHLCPFWPWFSVLGPLGRALLKAAPPWSFTSPSFGLFSKHYMEKVFCFVLFFFPITLPLPSLTLWLLLLRFEFFSRAANCVLQTWFKELSKQAKRMNPFFYYPFPAVIMFDFFFFFLSASD